MRDRQHARAGSDRLGEQLDEPVRIARGNGNRDLLHHDPVAFGALLPAGDSAGVLAVGQDDLVTALQIESLRDEVHAHRRILGQRDVRARSVHQLPQLLAQGQLRRIAADPVGGVGRIVPARDGRLQRAHVLDDALEHRTRRRAERSGVEKCLPRRDIELVAHPVPECRVIIFGPGGKRGRGCRPRPDPACRAATPCGR